ncbi:MAG: sugar kinase [Microbacteriaceae bacterium]|jgi:predicted NBD/HSP70 family sugar kinase|nr:sugar kinase [Microbacteriaceae bacterium]
MHEIGRAPGASELFQLLRGGQVRTRAELASLTGLARSTIGLRLDELLALGLISPAGDLAVSTGGRPPVQFTLNAGARVVLAADLGATHATVGIADLSGKLLAQHRERASIDAGPEVVLQWMVEECVRQLKSIGRERAEVIAVGIGLPGPVERSSGRAVNPPLMPGWDGFDAPGWVQQQLDVPVLVDNDVNIMALGERAVAFPGIDDLIFVKVATGIGAGVISSGTLQRGAVGVAGDIGHVQVARGLDIACRCGNRGCLEAIAAGPAIAEALTAAGRSVADSHAVISLVKQGDVEAIQAVRQAGRDIGEVLATCVSLVNPAVIAIGGAMAQAGEHLIAGIREAVYTRSMPLATEHLLIVQSRVGEDSALIGASMLAIEEALSPERITAMAVSA